jgi:TonB family protein
MISAAVELRPWPRRRWWISIALAFSVQVGLIFWLSDRTAVSPRLPAAFPALRIASPASAELLALNDPTLFVLPHQQGFSGGAWLSLPPPHFRFFEWSEEPSWLPFSIQPPGAVLNRAIELDSLSAQSTLARPEPEPTLPESRPLATGPAQSRLWLEGDLAGRRLLKPIELPSWRYKDLLTNSVVQVVVNPEGWPVSAPVLLSSSGYRDADEYALQQARTARFESSTPSGPGTTPSPTARLSWGRLVFAWHTLPPPLTNTPSTGP